MGLMKVVMIATALACGGTFAAAAAPTPAPAGATGLCNDGSYYSNAEKKGACRGHKGVKEWYGAAAVTAPANAPAVAPAPAAAKSVPAPHAAAPTAPSVPQQPGVARAPAAAASNHVPPQPAANQAPGGGPGMVWANPSTKVYHCSTDRWYGRTKSGVYLAEGTAQQQGYKPARDKACAAK